MKKLLPFLAIIAVTLFAAPPNKLHQITLAWTPANDGPVAGYTLYWGTNSGYYVWGTNAGNVTNFTIASDTLKSGTTYYFACVSYDFNGVESYYSNEVTNRFRGFGPTLNLINAQ